MSAGHLEILKPGDLEYLEGLLVCRFPKEATQYQLEHSL